MTKNPKSDYKIRFNDCDLFGHLNNARYVDYFMNAREDHLKDTYDLELAEYYKTGLAWVVTNHEIAYLRSALYNETVTIESTLLRADNDSLLVEMLMTDKDQSHIKSIMRTKFTAINPKTGRKEQHPSEFMEWAKTIQNSEVVTQNLQVRIKELRQTLKEKEVV